MATDSSRISNHCGVCRVSGHCGAASVLGRVEGLDGSCDMQMDETVVGSMLEESRAALSSPIFLAALQVGLSVTWVWQALSAVPSRVSRKRPF